MRTNLQLIGTNLHTSIIRLRFPRAVELEQPAYSRRKPDAETCLGLEEWGPNDLYALICVHRNWPRH